MKCTKACMQTVQGHRMTKMSKWVPFSIFIPVWVFLGFGTPCWFCHDDLHQEQFVMKKLLQPIATNPCKQPIATRIRINIWKLVVIPNNKQQKRPLVSQQANSKQTLPSYNKLLVVNKTGSRAPFVCVQMHTNILHHCVSMHFPLLPFRAHLVHTKDCRCSVSGQLQPPMLHYEQVHNASFDRIHHWILIVLGGEGTQLITRDSLTGSNVWTTLQQRPE